MSSHVRLSEQLFVSNGNITHLVHWLVREGLVSIERCTRDRRSTITRLTPAGATAFAELSREHHQWIDAMFRRLGRSEKDRLFALLGGLRASVEQHSGEEEGAHAA